MYLQFCLLSPRAKQDAAAAASGVVVVLKFIFKLNENFHEWEREKKMDRGREREREMPKLEIKLNFFPSFFEFCCCCCLTSSTRIERRREEQVKSISLRQLIVWSRSRVWDIEHDLLLFPSLSLSLSLQITIFLSVEMCWFPICRRVEYFTSYVAWEIIATVSD